MNKYNKKINYYKILKIDNQMKGHIIIKTKIK